MGIRINTRWLVIGVVVLGVSAGLVFLFQPPPVPVELAAARAGPIEETVSDQGQARVRQSFTVAAPVSGDLQRLPLEVGDRVTAGQTIVARIRPAAASLLDSRSRAQAQAGIVAAEAAVASAQAERGRLAAEAARASADLARTSALARQGFASRSALEAAQAAARASAEAVRSADAGIRLQQANLAAARAALTGAPGAGGALVSVTSPTNGVVTALLQQSSRPVAAGSPLIEIGDTDGLEAAIEFTSQDAVRIRPGQAAVVYGWGGERDLPAVVRLVEPHGFTKISALGVEEQRVLVWLQFTGPAVQQAGLAPGYRLWGRVVLRRTPRTLLIPVGALVRSDSSWACFRLEAGRARLRHVRVGTITDRDAEVLAGLSMGDRLVVYPSDRVRDGVQITAASGSAHRR